MTTASVFPQPAAAAVIAQNQPMISIFFLIVSLFTPDILVRFGKYPAHEKVYPIIANYAINYLII